MNQQLEALGGAMREELAAIPETMAQEEVRRQALVWLLAGAVKGMGLTPVMNWRPPKSTRERIDLVGVRPGSHPPVVEVAFVVDPLVELTKVRSLEWVECPHKVVVSFSERADKVSQSTFFLTPQLQHLALYK